ncbi:MAG: hypothetical protein JST11_12105 [Acidobacteria bacterium]|nr:hypothetical protein [Acidobacteriota bacterium]
MFTVGSVVLFGMLGLVTDIGWAYYRKEAAQAAAQAAAGAAVKAAFATSGGTIVCGANNVVCQSETACPASVTGYGTTNIDKACLYAAANGFATAGRQKVTLETGTGSVNGITVTYYAKARVSEGIPQLFSAVLGNNLLSLTARSSVGYIPASGGGCIYVLSPTGVSMTMNGNTALNTGCGVYVNSNDPGALTMSGNNASITATGGSKVNVVGGVNYGPNPANISPAPVTGVTSPGDPLAGMDPPTDGTCLGGVTVNNNQTTNIGPGTYCGDINVKGGGTLNLSPGVYIIKGSTTGGLSVAGQGAISGAGVTLIFETGTVNFAGGANSSLSAPASGTWQGILMYQERTNTQTASLVGGASQLTNGILYFPSAALNYTGGSSGNSQSATIVSNTLSLVGNSFIQASSTSPYLNTVSGVVVVE